MRHQLVLCCTLAAGTATACAIDEAAPSPADGVAASSLRVPAPALPSGNLFAVVDLNGTAVAGNHVQSVTRFGTGRYEVTFDQNISSCAYIATTANAYSQAIIAYTAGGHLGPQGVYVETKNQAASPTARSTWSSRARGCATP
jgi:hypothetical protein